jgi:predicted metal-dependent phosphoesterase TrpH
MIKGAIHIHSIYSDGEFTLAELREIFLAEGCVFLCMTDHAEYFDSAKLQSYLDECASLSDAKLRFIPGLEYRCQRDMHILGYGATQLAVSKEPQKVIAHITSQGAVSVIAHPKNTAFAWIESFQALPQGIEAWNTKYDGRYAPRPGTFALVQRLRQRKPDLRAFCGMDLHWKNQFRGMFMQVSCSENVASQVLAALSRGDFYAQKGGVVLPSSGVLPQALLDQLARARKHSERMQRLMRQAKGALERIGFRVPEAIKARLRRIF